MGRGRTTTAMILAALVYQRLHPQLQMELRIPVQSSSAESVDDDALRRGEYAVIRSLVRVVENGKEAKETVDEVCIVASFLKPFLRRTLVVQWADNVL